MFEFHSLVFQVYPVRVLQNHSFQLNEIQQAMSDYYL